MTHFVVLSGGLDSTCALAVAASVGDDVRAISFDYGQRHARELTSAVAVAKHYGIPHTVVNLRTMLHGSALLFEGDVPEGHYAQDNMSETVVSGRNLLFASAAVAAASPGDAVWFGVHAGDHPVYPDCRPEFWEDLSGLVGAAYQIDIVTPFVHVSKSEALTQGVAAGAPVELSWSCYKGGETHCGRCGTCVERAEAFALAGIEDPTVYADANYWRTVIA